VVGDVLWGLGVWLALTGDVSLLIEAGDVDDGWTRWTRWTRGQPRGQRRGLGGGVVLKVVQVWVRDAARGEESRAGLCINPFPTTMPFSA
jgi:hypothetical protein